MPIVAVGAAIAASAVAATSVVATGIAAISAVTAFEVVAAVGATIGAIGAVTRDKTLSMVGLAIGAVGGIGGLAASAGILGEAAASSAPLFGAAPTSAAEGFAEGALTPATFGTSSGVVEGGAFDVGGAASAADAASSGTVDFVANGMGEVPSGVNMAGEDAASLGKHMGMANDPSTPTELGLSTATDPVKVPDAAGTAADAASKAPPAPIGAETGFQPAGATGVNPELAANKAALPDSLTGGTGGMFDGMTEMMGKLVKYAGDHPVVAMGALQAGGSFLSGMTSSLTPAQAAAANAQAAANNAQAKLAESQARTMAMPKAVASSAPVTGTPQPLIPQAAQMAGLINRQPAVTGVAA